MQRDEPQILQVQVPTDFSAIAIIDLHPSAPQAHSEGEIGRPLFASWASGLVSALKRQQCLKPLLAYEGELISPCSKGFKGLCIPCPLHQTVPCQA